MTPFSAARLVHIVNDLEMMRASVHAAAAEYDRFVSDADGLQSTFLDFIRAAG